MDIVEAGSQAGVEIINNKLFWINHQGGYTSDELVKPKDKLEDQTVRKILKFARDLSAQVARFKIHTMSDLAALDQLVAEQYGFVKRGNKGKGNRTYMSYDGLLQVTVQVAEFMDFGSELQIAKTLIDECLTEWAADSRPEIQTIVTRAFNTDQEGKVNRSEILMLLRLAITDPRWLQAMDAIRDAQRPRSSKEYVRFAMRGSVKHDWMTITVDLAKA
ncbi:MULTISPECIES: DUF3164 family protein [unclassified Mesorhizobium]|uniref:DUF3164 family protein n=1 Tax=unclassified Mesorhizobium TaxID=325217 RepID=UPI0003CE0547|nr:MULTISPECIES: DUF3164 family protein [unclassified Mesorhizobium]ESY48988.1 hypothetical protein X745_27825 [Mesorhizobium sp. LNJC374B00]ESY52774.1 hypothetical protein X744_28775 [Mesorhizobium sp. LNJC372A00]WJI81495.1 DUF3164 family protein [Mesorhizobium sp. C374B]WJI88014.1 DUF3164 family protein [Mesorhizobium sp. C372A]